MNFVVNSKHVSRWRHISRDCGWNKCQLRVESRDGTEPEIFVLKFLSNMMYLPYPHCTILAGISVKIILNFKNLYCWKFMWTEQKSMKSNLYLARNLFWLIIHPYYHSSRLVSIKKNRCFEIVYDDSAEHVLRWILQNYFSSLFQLIVFILSKPLNVKQ